MGQTAPGTLRVLASVFAASAVVLIVAYQSDAEAKCGGSERWPVKVASDPDAGKIDLRDVKDITVVELNALEPSEAIAANDETTRMSAERQVYRVHGYVAMYRPEADGDYHIAISDTTGRVTEGGRGTTPTGHSFVAEIPRLACVSGKRGQYPKTSVLAEEIGAARNAFEDGVKDVDAKAISPKSIPVTVTGVLFFDRDHGQTGRTKMHEDDNGKALVTELHPVLKIEFADK